MSDGGDGWHWFDLPADLDQDAEISNVEKCFARCFAGEDGRRALNHLRALTIEQITGPAASDAALRHLEGQRYMVAVIARLVLRGSKGNNGEPK